MSSNADLRLSQRRIKARNRIDKACNNCRRRKEKCDGAQPKCSSCAVAGRECHYAHEVKRRGLQEGWVHALEKAWAVAILGRPEIQSEVVAVLENGTQDPQRGGFGALWTDEADEAGLLKTWRSSDLCRELERLLPRFERLQRHKISSLAPTELDIFAVRSAQEQTASAERSFGPPGQQSSARPLTQWPESSPRLSTDATLDMLPSDQVQLPPDVLQVVDDYFRSTHVWFPVAEKHRIYRLCHTWANKDQAELGGRTCVLAILNVGKAVKAGSTSEDTVEHARFSVPGVLDFTSLFANEIPTMSKLQDLGYVQALLVLSITRITSGSVEEAWLLVGQAMRLAMLRIKSVNSVTQGMPRATHNLQDAHHRALLACMVLDTLCAVALGQQPLFPISLLDLLGPIDEDGIEEWEPSDESSNSARAPALMLSTFNRLVCAVKSLYLVLRDTQTTAGLDSSGVPITHAQDQWFTDPMHFDGELDDAVSPALPQQVSVYLVRLTTKLISELRNDNTASAAPANGSARMALLQKITDLIDHGLQLGTKTTAKFLWQLILKGLLVQAQQSSTNLSTAERTQIIELVMQQVHLLERKDNGSQSNVSDPPLIDSAFEPVQPLVDSDNYQDPAGLTSVLNTIDRAVSNQAAAPVRSDVGPWPPEDTPWLGSIGDDSSHNGLLEDLITMDAIDWNSSWEQSFQGLGFPMNDFDGSEFQYDFSNT
ncbi:uncharacterized protein HMPREF1541_05529 [Cyphellophora europaea CBS 101466]|uniref:Zn(2)-C6 fungal-type domain-containing protein n=1 Tax=Cyphellophora europaea (strain CBS 101466) TaxID=1220924 RepID=W2RS10_CYPE1|nr:uncharacterized protein HMPREF1541_05529 [Cyphellophora europaea CBS 101466]ETN39306.1 hypothetical protein HMPREF1541_05529 [Cyphellophora europaea CBS 101466]